MQQDSASEGLGATAQEQHGPRKQAPQGGRAVILVDGIVSSTIKWLTPDISWHDYAEWLRQRRPDIDVVHLNQPHDWLEILAGRALKYEDVVHEMLLTGINSYRRDWNEVAILGFSMGGLTALEVTLQFARELPDERVDYLAYVSIGTPFGGVGPHRDRLLSRVSLDYVQRIFELEANRKRFLTLCQHARFGQLSILIGQIDWDEIVSPASSLRALDWLAEAQRLPGLSWGTFNIATALPFRAHDGLLHDNMALCYIDGLVDGLLPPPADTRYEPYWDGKLLRLARRFLKVW